MGQGQVMVCPIGSSAGGAGVGVRQGFIGVGRPYSTTFTQISHPSLILTQSVLTPHSASATQPSSRPSHLTPSYTSYLTSLTCLVLS